MVLKNTQRKATSPVIAPDASPPIPATASEADAGATSLALVTDGARMTGRTRAAARRAMPVDPNSQLLTPEQVEAEFGITLSALATWRSRGGGPKFMRPRPRIIRYRRGAVLEWLGAEVSSTGEAQHRATN